MDDPKPMYRDVDRRVSVIERQDKAAVMDRDVVVGVPTSATMLSDEELLASFEKPLTPVEQTPREPQKPIKPRKASRQRSVEAPAVTEPDWTWRTRRMDALLANHTMDLLNAHFSFGEAVEQIALLQQRQTDVKENQRIAKRDMEMARDAILLDGSIDGKNEAIRAAQLTVATARHTGYCEAEQRFYGCEAEIAGAEADIALWLRRIKALEMQHQLLVAQLEVLAR